MRSVSPEARPKLSAPAGDTEKSTCTWGIGVPNTSATRKVITPRGAVVEAPVPIVVGEALATLSRGAPTTLRLAVAPDLLAMLAVKLAAPGCVPPVTPTWTLPFASLIEEVALKVRSDSPTASAKVTSAPGSGWPV